MNHKQKVAVVLGALVIAGLGVASCGEDRNQPGIPGRYVLDREATSAAHLAAVAALADDTNPLPKPGEDPGDPEDLLRHVLQYRERLAHVSQQVERGTITMEMTFCADGTWTGRYLEDDQPHKLAGTWTRRGDDLTFSSKSSRDDVSTARHHEGTLHIYDVYGKAVYVLRRQEDASCGDEATPGWTPSEIPEWAKVAPEQIAEAKKHGVPVAFENDLEMRFVLIPAGTFLMGSPESEEGRYGHEGPQHEVTLSPFYLAVTEVTNAQYRRFRADHDSGSWDGVPLNGDDQPVLEVSHEDATAFVRWLSRRGDGGGYRLPSEAEWEYACRAGTSTPYWSGATEEELARVGWYIAKSEGTTHPVGQKPANAFGLHDMHGNVWEWCEDEYHESYGGAPDDGRAWVDGKGPCRRVYRGGSWANPARDARSAFRYGLGPGLRFCHLGFRPARAFTSE